MKNGDFSLQKIDNLEIINFLKKGKRSTKKMTIFDR